MSRLPPQPPTINDKSDIVWIDPSPGAAFWRFKPSSGTLRPVSDVLTGDACRSARFLLGLSLRQLSDASHVHKDTIHKFENGANVHDRTRHDLRRAFETAGVEFVLGDKRETCQISLPDGWIVRLKPED